MKKFFLSLLILSLWSCKGTNKNQESLQNQNREQEQDQVQSQPKDKEISNLIQITEPTAGDTLTTPVTIKGRARGTWFFEGDFPVYLLDENGKEISVAIATAQGEWMTEEWVDFTATLEFEETSSTKGVLRFEKSNPSDRRDLDRSYEILVNFR